MTNDLLPVNTTPQELIASFNKQVPKQEQTSEVSLYGTYEIQTKEEAEMYYTKIHDNIEQLIYAFSTCDSKGNMIPAHPYQFYTTLCKCIFENRIPIDRVAAAAKHLMMNHKYTKFVIADFLNFDVKIKTFTKDDVYKMCGQFPSSIYPLVKFPDGREAYVSLSDYNMHKLDKETEKNVRDGKEPLVKAVLMIDDFKRYDAV